MTPSPVNVSKLTILKMDVVISDIYRIFKSIDSEYTVGKRKLSEARSVLYSDTKKAYRLIRSARKDIVEESKAAQEYNHYRGIISQIDDKAVSELDSRYHELIGSGKYKKAKEVAIRISEYPVIRSSGHSIDVKLNSVSEKGLEYIVTNYSNRNIDVKRFTVFVEAQQLPSDVVYPFTIHHNSTIRVLFDCTVENAVKASVIFEYTDDGIVKTLSFESPLRLET